MVDQLVGKRLSQEVAQQTGKRLEPGAVALMLANPIEVKSTVHNLLPDGTGNGLSAFYYSLLLLLAGFTGSIVVSMMVDSMLGFVPAEAGRVYRFAEQVKISRLRTLLIKWAMMAVLALAHIGRLSVDRRQNWACRFRTVWRCGFSARIAILAVGVTSTSLIADTRRTRCCWSACSYSSSSGCRPAGRDGATAEPPRRSSRWLARNEPMHQVFLGRKGAAASAAAAPCRVCRSRWN